jgi:hypothetical protein
MTSEDDDEDKKAQIERMQKQGLELLSQMKKK